MEKAVKQGLCRKLTNSIDSVTKRKLKSHLLRCGTNIRGDSTLNILTPKQLRIERGKRKQQQIQVYHPKVAHAKGWEQDAFLLSPTSLSCRSPCLKYFNQVCILLSIHQQMDKIIRMRAKYTGSFLEHKWSVSNSSSSYVHQPTYLAVTLGIHRPLIRIRLVILLSS